MAEEGFFSGAGEEEEKETMRARCRKEVFEYSGVIPSQLVRKHLSSVLLSHQKTNNSLLVSSSSSSLSFEQRVMQTQERLLERCEKREEEDKEEDKEEEQGEEMTN